MGLLKQCAQGSGEKQLYLWSASTTGKTHLLQASCQYAAAHNYASCYLPLAQLHSYGVEILQGLAKLALVAIDDIQLVVGQAEWERALFSLINEVRSSQTRLLIAANANIADMNWQLADLSSRLAWGPIFEVRELVDEDKLLLLQQRAEQRGLQMPDEVATYLLSRYPRDMRSLSELFATLDRASLAEQRRLTIPFVKSVLEKD